MRNKGKGGGGSYGESYKMGAQAVSSKKVRSLEEDDDTE